MLVESPDSRYNHIFSIVGGAVLLAPALSTGGSSLIWSLFVIVCGDGAVPSGSPVANALFSEGNCQIPSRRSDEVVDSLSISRPYPFGDKRISPYYIPHQSWCSGRASTGVSCLV